MRSLARGQRTSAAKKCRGMTKGRPQRKYGSTTSEDLLYADMVVGAYVFLQVSEIWLLGSCLSLIVDAHFTLLFMNKDYSEQPDMDHCTRLRHAYSIFRGIPRLYFQALTKIGLNAQWRLIENALLNIKSMDNVHAMMGRLLYNSHPSCRICISAHSSGYGSAAV
jgi:hypothetical protein